MVLVHLKALRMVKEGNQKVLTNNSYRGLLCNRGSHVDVVVT